MATRKRREWKTGSDGKYARQIGWKWGKSGKKVQHKFRLGTNLREAGRREARLRHLWDTIERRISQFDFDGPLWNELTLGWAKQIAAGTYPPRVQIDPDELPREYASRLLQLRYSFSGFPLDPHDVSTFEIGLKHMTVDPRQRTPAVRLPNAIVLEPATICPVVQEAVPLQLTPEDALRISPTESDLVKMNASSEFASREVKSGESFHEALRAYQAHLRREFKRPVSENGTPISDHGHTLIKQIDTIVARQSDRELETLDLAGVDGLYGYWQVRPKKLNSEDQVAASTAKNHIDLLKRFFKWLHRSTDFAWRKPDDFDDLSTRVVRLRSDTAGGLEQVGTFRVDELEAVFEYATPLERAFFLLALNCGFTAMEIATLRWDEVFLFTAHEPHLQEILGTKTSDKDSFVKRRRGKSSVYGEWLLFEPTVSAVQWLRRRYESFGRDVEPLVVLNQAGRSYAHRTSGGNPNRQIANRFAANKKRARDSGYAVANHPFKSLRKTGGDLVRRFGDGEVSGVFLAHEQAVRQDGLADIYSNRPFGRLFDVMRRIEQHLQPVFQAAGPNPFPDGTE